MRRRDTKRLFSTTTVLCFIADLKVHYVGIS